MKLKAWHWGVAISSGLIIILLFMYFLVPIVRYKLLPVTGGTDAPDTLEVHPGPASSTLDWLFSPARAATYPEREIPANGGWINSGSIDLKKVEKENKCTLIDFWTYTCINCIRATPYTQELWDRYKDHGLVVIGVHSPEFEVEKDPKNVLAAVKRAGITYPVETDANMTIWNRFGNHFWPGKYLISPKGKIIYTNFGEGDYDKEERAVRDCLRSANWRLPNYGPGKRYLEPVKKETTPELYAGAGFLHHYGNKEEPKLGQATSYTLPPAIAPDKIYLQGTWSAAKDYVQSESKGKILLSYLANAVYIVLDKVDRGPGLVKVLLDGKPVPDAFRGKDIVTRDNKTFMRVDEPRLYYPIKDRAPYGRHLITFVVPKGLGVYSFTFGAY